jgi:benzoylformate decarboxylase
MAISYTVMSVVLGRDILFEFLEDQDIPYIFGNPGTTELPLVDGCNDHPSVKYVLALHEDIAVAQAMGWARASGKVGVVNLHVTPGVAHGLGNLYNAFHARVPLLVTAGQHHSAFQIQEPILTSDLAELVRPFTKWSYEVTALEELPLALQRAFKEVNTPPFAPVFLSIASNLFLDKWEAGTPARVSRVASVTSDDDAFDRGARELANARNPLIISGDGVGLADAWAPMAALAETLGAPVLTEGYATIWNFPADHPHYLGPMPNVATQMRNTFDDVDVVLMCGVTCHAPIARYDEGGPLIPWRVRVVSVDDSPRDMGKIGPVEVGLVGDIKRNLGTLLDAVRKQSVDRATVTARSEQVRERSRARVEQHQNDTTAARAKDELSPSVVAAELDELLPSAAIYVDEAVSNRPAFVNAMKFRDPMSFFSANGISLGYSVGVAVGMQMALPARRIVNVVGDGSLMYYPQALWSASSAQVPVIFLVLNNGCYRVLKVIIDRMGGPWGSDGERTPGLDFRSPGIDFVAMAESMGLTGQRATTPGELRAALERALRADGPFLVDVVLQQD